MEQQSTLITAHSGADHTPENSMEFVRHALESRADVLEIDVRTGKDRTLIITHDETDGEAVSLREVFDTVKKVPYIRINCDLKETGIEEEVFRLAEECALPAERILYSGSVSREDLEKGGRWREVEVYWNVEECIPDVYEKGCGESDSHGGKGLSQKTADRLISDCGKYGITVININEKFLGSLFIKKMKENGIGISAWTANDPERIKQLLDCGMHNITTRNLAAALVLREKKERT